MINWKRLNFTHTQREQIYKQLTQTSIILSWLLSLNDFFSCFSFFLFFFPQIFNTQDRLGSVWYYWLGCHVNFSSLGYTTTKFKPWPSVAAGHPSFDCNPIFRMENASLSIFLVYLIFNYLFNHPKETPNYIEFWIN